MNRLDDDATAAANAAAPTGQPAGPPQSAGQPAPGAPVQQQPTMPPPPVPSGGGWGAPVPSQEQQPPYAQQQRDAQQSNAPQQQYGPPQQYQQPQYGPPGQQPYYPPQQYDQGGYQQQYAPPPPPQQPQYPPPPPEYPQYQQPPAPQYDPQQYQQQPPPPQQPQYEQPPYGVTPPVPPAPYEQYPQQQYGPPPQQPQYQQPEPQHPRYEQQTPQYQQPAPQQPQYEQPAPYQQPAQQYQQPVQYDPNYGPSPQGGGAWDGPPPQDSGGWDSPGPEGPGTHAYTPTYHDPLAGPLPVVSDSVGLEHEDRPGAGGFFRRIGRFAAEAAYIAGASGRMQRDVENIAIIRRPIGIGRMIGVMGPVPSSGTSIVTALLADTIAAQRTDLVLAVDACPREGKLTHRLENGVANAPNSRVQLARAEPTADAISDVLAARNVGGANQIPLSLVDCPAGLYEEATAYVAGASHAVALVIPSSRDDALNSINELDRLTPDGQHMLVQKGLVIIAENHPDDPEPVRWLQSAVSDRGLGYVVLPYDDHLARAWPLRPEALDPATRRAVLELTARLIERATTR
ncbi:MinD-like ATPase involved in chromosome partitioning or flagellar assembly [Kribbella sp. VKM Ac-2527]|uniref:MinD-like ATPase involved in chromosome partitioning or flagellar assembly n=2 Tax=Kribbella caucasensis TaxID=2512215 RepID=A0A4R6KDK8_9ACTN|nr:MinD-like ATPase involved in chromosome partitioning or flagellar assembly [Kribbella sp. VKM Ac-2527]